MNGTDPPAITDADVRSFAAKLIGLHALLPPGERALLRGVLARAAAAAVADSDDGAWQVSFDPFMFLCSVALEP